MKFLKMPLDKTWIATLVLLVAVTGVIGYSQYTLLGMTSPIKFSLPGISAVSATTNNGTTFTVKSTGNTVQDVIKAVIPTGTPSYGEELAVSYDTPVPSLTTLAGLDRKIPTSGLTAEEKQRFISINTRISCEFCCGAPATVDQNGNSLCGCSHAASFRGLSKYLIKNHPAEYTDDQILLELTRWKALYYPRNMVEKGVAALQNGLELSPAVLNDRDLLKKIQSKDTSSIGELPSMVGGC